MGSKSFPGRGRRARLARIKPCCLEEANLRPYDCGCSWGCEVCWATVQCTVCETLHAMDPREERRRENRRKAKQRKAAKARRARELEDGDAHSAE